MIPILYLLTHLLPVPTITRKYTPLSVLILACALSVEMTGKAAAVCTAVGSSPSRLRDTSLRLGRHLRPSAGVGSRKTRTRTLQGPAPSRSQDAGRRLRVPLRRARLPCRPFAPRSLRFALGQVRRVAASPCRSGASGAGRPWAEASVSGQRGGRSRDDGISRTVYALRSFGRKGCAVAFEAQGPARTAGSAPIGRRGRASCATCAQDTVPGGCTLVCARRRRVTGARQRLGWRRPRGDRDAPGQGRAAGGAPRALGTDPCPRRAGGRRPAWSPRCSLAVCRNARWVCVVSPSV